MYSIAAVFVFTKLQTKEILLLSEQMFLYDVNTKVTVL